jgi:DNA-binding winged helix-turn-helix (wHTH) protein
VRTRFGPFTLDDRTRQLLRGGEEVHLPRKAFDLLSTLMSRRPEVVDKDELNAAIWPDSHVDPAGLNVLVGEVRKALGDDARQPRFLRTVHGVGYAFCGDAVHVEEAPASSGPACWLVWNDRTFRLTDGENVIGRDPRCAVWVDADRVSRRHAALLIDEANDTVALRDLDSTNGTFVGRPASAREPSERATARQVGRAPVELSDGDEVTVGSVVLKFRRWLPDTAPETRRIRRKRNRPGNE